MVVLIAKSQSRMGWEETISEGFFQSGLPLGVSVGDVLIP